MNSFFRHAKQDLPASIVVFLVALPLCLGIAVASGAPPIAGVIAGAVGGIVVGLMSRSPLGVSGPAAGLTAIVLVAIQDLGSYETLLAAVVLAGVVQIVLGFLRMGIIAYYFPHSVIHGMLAGIGVLIILTQLTHGVGYDKSPESDLSYNFSELAHLLDFITPGAIVITSVCLGLLILWDTKAIKGNKVLGQVPGSMLAVVVGMVLGQLFHAVPFLSLDAEHFVDLPTIRGLGDLPRMNLIDLMDPRVWKVALVIAIVASLETLLCVEATDKMDPWKRVTPANRELHAQGIGNIVSGLLGGIPLTQVVVRSSANIQTGGRSRLSTVMHGVLILVAVLAFPGLLRMVPLASLAAVLFVVGYKLIKPKQFVHMWHQGWMRFLPFVLTAAGVAFIDLLSGVGLGLAVAIMHILWKNYKVPFHFDPRTHKAGMPIHIQMSEDVTFLNKAGIKRTLNELPDGSHVILDASRTIDLDPDVLEDIEEFRGKAGERNIHVELIGFMDGQGRAARIGAPERSIKQAVNTAP